MRVAEKIRELVDVCSVQFHARRREALLAGVVALVECGRATSAAAGRAMAKATSEKHGIKRMDRLLGNRALHRDRLDAYARLAALTVGDTVHPVVLVDWTAVGGDKYVLKAVLAFRGRGVPLYAECHTRAANGNPNVQRRFLSRLKRVLPSDCCPVIVTDAGFKVPWCAAVVAMGWDYVTRVRGRTFVRVDDESPWFLARNSTQALGPGLHDLPDASLNYSNAVTCRLVAWDERSKRARKMPTDTGRRISVRRAVRGAYESWLLASSISTGDAKTIVELYALRMQIELSIRDDKSHALGWGLRDARTRSCERFDNQLLLVAVATLAALWVGIAAEQSHLARRYQANTERRRRVLSLVTLGRRVLTRAVDIITKSQLATALQWLRDHIPRLLVYYVPL